MVWKSNTVSGRNDHKSLMVQIKMVVTFFSFMYLFNVKETPMNKNVKHVVLNSIINHGESEFMYLFMQEASNIYYCKF
jgi:hypothetical protein